MAYTELQRKCIEIIHEGVHKAQVMYDRQFRMPSIEFSNRLTSCAGKANGYHNHIKLSNQLLIDNGDNFINRTTLHELGHILAYQMYGGRQGHNWRWKSICQTIGMTDVTRCHSYKVTKRRNVKSYSAKCDCMVFTISAQRRGRMLNGTNSYRCRDCKGKLVLV